MFAFQTGVDDVVVDEGLGKRRGGSPRGVGVRVLVGGGDTLEERATRCFVWEGPGLKRAGMVGTRF